MSNLLQVARSYRGHTFYTKPLLYRSVRTLSKKKNIFQRDNQGFRSNKILEQDIELRLQMCIFFVTCDIVIKNSHSSVFKNFLTR